MPGTLGSGTFWLVAANVGLASLVLLPLVAVLAAAVAGILARPGRRRRREVRWERIPGLGVIPVLHR